MIAPLNPLENIPGELKSRDQFICWRYEDRDGKPTKTPVAIVKCFEIPPAFRAMQSETQKPGLYFRPHGRADVTNCFYHLPFDRAANFLEQSKGSKGRLQGIGFVFTKDDDFFGIDLDNCIDPVSGEIKPWAREIIAQFHTYCEISPSGTGVKLFARGRLPIENTGRRKKLHGGEIEVYHHGRFFAVTGRRLDGSPTSVNDCQAAVDELFHRLWPKPAPKATQPASHCDLPDDEIIDRILASRTGDKFRRLWDGDTSGHGNDHSAADLSLCLILAFWTGGDAAAIDRLLRQSDLNRDKWERDDYRGNTIEKAIDSCTDFYQWGRERNSSSNEDSSTRSTVTHNCCEGDNSELAPGIEKPEIDLQFSSCRKIKVRMTSRDDHCHKRISGFACRCNSCETCKPAWQSNRIEWFSSIVNQWPEIYQTVATDDADSKRIRARVYRKSKQVENLYSVSVPMANGKVLWLVTHAVSGFSEVTQEEAGRALDYAIRDVPDGRRIGCTRSLSFKHNRESETSQWERDKDQGPLSQTTWSKIKQVLRDKGLAFVERDLAYYERLNLEFRVPQNWTEADSQRLDELMIDDYWAEIGERVDAAHTGRAYPQNVPEKVACRSGPRQLSFC